MTTASGDHANPFSDPALAEDQREFVTESTLTVGRDASLTLGTDSLIVLGITALHNISVTSATHFRIQMKHWAGENP